MMRLLMLFAVQLLSVLEHSLSKLARYDQSSLFSSILSLTVSSPTRTKRTHSHTHTHIHAGTTVHAINYTSSRVGVELLLPIITIARCAYFCHSAPGRVKKVPGSPYSIAERRVPELIPVLGSQPAGG